MIRDRIVRLVEGIVAEKMRALEASMEERMTRSLQVSMDERMNRAIAEKIFKPRLPPMNSDGRPFMPYSSCSAEDFLHPSYREWCARIFSPPVLHRKMWEWVFVLHHLELAGMFAEGRRGICFGVGKESLPAYIAGRGAAVMATDAPPHLGQAGGWIGSGEHAESLESLRQPMLCPNEQFDKLVDFRYCDMTAIDEGFSGFDFTWSSCCFEHLGSLEAGMAFVVDSVERCLKVGGIAVHTTELNLTSDDATMTEGNTVIYRRRDIVELVERLRNRGHDVQPFRHAPDAHALDFHVDTPPYTHEPHIKLQLGSWVTTSVGIVVRRGV